MNLKLIDSSKRQFGKLFIDSKRQLTFSILANGVSKDVSDLDIDCCIVCVIAWNAEYVKGGLLKKELSDTFCSNGFDSAPRQSQIHKNFSIANSSEVYVKPIEVSPIPVVDVGTRFLSCDVKISFNDQMHPSYHGRHISVSYYFVCSATSRQTSQKESSRFLIFFNPSKSEIKSPRTNLYEMLQISPFNVMLSEPKTCDEDDKWSPSPEYDNLSHAAHKSGYLIERDGEFICMVNLNKTNVSIGQEVSGYIDFTDCSVACHKFEISLVYKETLCDSVRYGSASDFNFVTVSQHKEICEGSHLMDFHLAAPFSAPPAFVSNIVKLEWAVCLKIMTYKRSLTTISITCDVSHIISHHQEHDLKDVSYVQCTMPISLI